MDLSLLPDFITETVEHLEEMEANLLQLEKKTSNREALDNVFRTAHSIKGNAEYLGIEKISALSHSLENILELLRNNHKKLKDELIETLFNVQDRLVKLVNELSYEQKEISAIDDLLTDLESYALETPIDDVQTGQSEFNNTDEELLSELRQLIMEIARSELSEDRRIKMIDILNNLLSKPGQNENSCLIFERLIQQAQNMLFSDDAGDMLAELNKLIDENVKEKPENEIQADSLDDTYSDENDEELFIIYIQHLKDNLSLMKIIEGDFKTTDDYTELFKKSIDILDSLKSSANYMDYRKIVRIYEKWSARLEEFSENLFIDEDEDFKLFIDSGMSDYINSIISFFPQCEKELCEIITKNLTEKTEKPVPVPEESIEESSDNFIKVSDEIQENGGLFDELDNMFTTQEISGDSEYNLDEEPFLKGLEQELAASGHGNKVNKEAEPENEENSEPESDVVDSQEYDFQEEVSENDVDSEIVELQDETLSSEEKSEINENESAMEHDELVADEQAPEASANIVSEKIVKQSIRVDSRKIDSLMNQAGELVVSRAGFAQLFNEMVAFQHEVQDSSAINSKDLKTFKNLIFKLNESIISLGRVANELQDGVMKVRMLPISRLFNRYPRLVRDLIHGTDKEVRLDISGEETELDKMVIEAIADPLVHIIRNAIDHGAETVSERKAAGKPEACVLKLDSYHESNHVVIEILDDGRGIDHERIKTVAINNLSMTHDELNRMSNRDLTGLITLPGFSTSYEVTRTSGRGVGMDVVKSNIEKLNGTIDIDSIKNQGTRIRIKIPLTLAIIKALLVKVGSETFTIPLTTVEETLQIQESELSNIEGVEVIKLRDAVLPLLRLSDILNISGSSKAENLYVVVVNTGSRQTGLVVDELLGQEETVIKPLVDYLQENSGFSGATILGDGSISLILDIYELINLSLFSKNDRNKMRLINDVVKKASADKSTSVEEVTENMRSRILH